MSTTYLNLKEPVMVDGDALVAVRPDPVSGQRFLRLLRDRFAERGTADEWLMWAAGDESGVTLVWMRNACPDPATESVTE